MRARILIVSLALVMLGGFRLDAAPDPALVATSNGQLHGRIEGDVISFRGVPFAAPPVGALRWHAPMPVSSWSGVRQAANFAAPCAQAAMGWNDNTAAKSKEDCLYLNVWMPAKHQGPLPVLIFFPGGAYHGGGAEGLSEIEPSYDGGKLAARGMVVVTAGYRLGMFGFLAHPELSAESAQHVSGNYALLDNIAALKWVQANIARFGGDPANVTVSGQSAGAFTVGYLMTSPLAKGLFAKGVGFSGSVFNQRTGQPDLKMAEGVGVKFARAMGAPDKGSIAALRHMSQQDIIKVMMADPKIHASEPRGPVVDHYVFSEAPSLVFQAGREMPIPYLVGNTARDGDEDSMGVSGTPKADATLADKARPLSSTHKVAPLSPGDMQKIEAFYAGHGDLGQKAAKLYGDVRTTDPVDGDAAHAFQTDIAFRCGDGMAAALHAKIAPTYRYQFSHGYEPLGAVHLWDMFYVFGWLKAPADQPRDPRLVDQEQRYLVNFAAKGDPNGPGLPAWGKSGAGDAYMDFTSNGATAKSGLRTQACALFTQKTDQDLVAMKVGR